MGFKVFEKGSAPVSTVPTVTIQKRGLFSLNEAAFALLRNPAAVQFLWDEENRLIAIQAAKLEDPNAYPTRHQGSANTSQKRGAVLIAGTMFTKFIGLDTSIAKRWVPEHDGDLLIVDLNKPSQTVVSNRKSAVEAAKDHG